MHGARLWDRHPAVRSGADLTLGERAADFLKKWFGTWTALGAVAAVIAAWVVLQRTPARWDAYPFILLNLCLSCLAAVQGIILQISANRGDRISAEVALHTQGNTDALLDVNRQQLAILTRLDRLNGQVADLAEAVRVVMASRAEMAAAERAEVEAVRRAAEDTLAEVRAARKSADAAFVGVQALASVAVAKPEDGPAPSPPPLPAETPKPQGRKM